MFEEIHLVMKACLSHPTPTNICFAISMALCFSVSLTDYFN